MEKDLAFAAIQIDSDISDARANMLTIEWGGHLQNINLSDAMIEQNQNNTNIM